MSDDRYEVQGEPRHIASVLRDLAAIAEAGDALIGIEVEEHMPGDGPGANVFVRTWLRKADVQILFEPWDAMAD